MNDRLRATKCKRVVDLCGLATAILVHKGNVPRSTRREVVKFKRIFSASTKDDVIGELMQGVVKGIEALESYIISRNDGNEVLALKHQKEVGRLFTNVSIIGAKVQEELRVHGV